jgi:hypothetical protein
MTTQESSLPIDLFDREGSIDKRLLINGEQLQYSEFTLPPYNKTSTWKEYFDLRDNLEAVGNAPNTTTLRVENTLRLTDNLGNTRNISTLSNPATTIDIAQTDASGIFYPVFTDVNGTSKSLSVDNAVGPLSYNPSTSTLTASTFSGTSTGIQLTGNSANSERSVPFSTSTIGGARTLNIDTQTNAIQYNPGLQRLSVNNIRTFGTISSDSNITIDPVGVLTVQANTEIFGQLDMEANSIVNCPQVRNNAGDIEIKANSSGAGGNISLTAGTDLLSATAGGNSGLHLKLTINGTAYKIALLNV